MTIRSDASLRGKSRAVARKHGLSAQEVTQMYLFERFLARLAKSGYRERFILKGGLLISSLIGVASRTTMDMDATVCSMSLDEDTVKRMVSEICAVDIDDGVAFEYIRCETIRDDDDYGGLRAHIRARFGRMDAPMKIDLTTGDAITPSSVEYQFPLLFDEGSLSLMTYPLETCIAEKFEAIVKRGVTTTRARDFYDISCLMRVYGARLDWGIVTDAVERTASRRGSLDLLRDYEAICAEMMSCDALERVWANYVDRNRYAVAVSLHECIDAVRLIGNKVFLA